MPSFLGFFSIAVQFFLYLGIFTASGTVLATRVFYLQSTRSLTLFFALVGLCATLISYALSAIGLSGGLSDALDPEIHSLLSNTVIGNAFKFRLIGLGILISGVLIGRYGQWIAMVGALIAIASFLQIGHIQGLETYLSIAILYCHLLAVSMWIGILIPLRRMLVTAPNLELAAKTALKFGRLASVFVPILILAGGYMTWILVNSFENLVLTTYGQTLIVKVLLVAVLLGFAAVNKVRFTPRLQAGSQVAASSLSNSIEFEWIIILFVLMVTAVLTTGLTLPS